MVSHSNDSTQSKPHGDMFSEVLGSESDTTENYFNACFYSHLVIARNADMVISEPHPYVQNVG